MLSAGPSQVMDPRDPGSPLPGSRPFPRPAIGTGSTQWEAGTDALPEGRLTTATGIVDRSIM